MTAQLQEALDKAATLAEALPGSPASTAGPSW